MGCDVVGVFAICVFERNRVFVWSGADRPNGLAVPGWTDFNLNPAAS